MLLEGSCHCNAVTFTVNSRVFYPYMLCYCSVCRKTAGSGGYAINLSADADSLEVKGRENISVYQATIDGTQSQAQRNFCSKCASALWLWDPRWPELLHPFASAIDSPLPRPPQNVHIMQSALATWVEPNIKQDDLAFDEYPEESIADWHRRHGLLENGGE